MSAARPLFVSLLLLSAFHLHDSTAGQESGTPPDPVIPPSSTEPEVEPPPEKKPEWWPESWPFTLHGGAYLWHYQPFVDGVDENTELYAAYFLLDVPWDAFRFHFEPRFRNTKLRPFFESNVWVQEVYLEWKPSGADGPALKAGKLYSRFGRFWDGSFFGNVPYLDGLKLDPDYGVSLEGTQPLAGDVSHEYALQYFTVDGSTNGSLQDRDTLSIDGARQRRSTVARWAPRLALGEASSVAAGASGQVFQADFPSGAEDDTVTRWGGDVELVHRDWTAFGELARQRGRSVLDFPLPGQSSDDVEYAWAGIEKRCGPLSVRYNFSSGKYRDQDVRETIHQPGLVYDLDEHVRLYLEFDYWDRSEPGAGGVVDRSLNFVLNVNF